MPKTLQRQPGSKGRASKRKSTSRIEIGTEAVKRRHTYENECTAENDMESNYFLKFVTGTKIRVCYGCAKAIRVPPYVPAPPYDVVICRKEYRSYLQDGVPKLTLTPQNVHYHLRETCLKLKNPEFDKDTVIVCPPDVKERFQDVHRKYLSCFNVKY